MDYLAWRGDITFRERPLNEIDNLVLAELSYAEMEDIVPEKGGGTVPLREVAAAYREKGYQSVLINDPGPLLAAAGESMRYAPVRAGSYVNHIDPDRQVQFSAVSFYLPDGALYVAFRGTDDTIVGWREDFNFSFTETPGQTDAAAYLNEVGAAFDGPIYVGGHSKGGNLAVYAAAFCGAAVQEKIARVYSNDGPGFHQAVVASPQYQEMLGKVQSIIPESSLVGILLSSQAERKIVKSSASGILQHNPLTWQVRGTAFELVDSQSPASLFLDEALSRWIDGLDDQQRQHFVSAVFDSMDASGIQTVTALHAGRWDAAVAVLKALLEIDPARRREVLGILKKLRDSGRDVLLEDAKAAIDQLIKQAVAKFKFPRETI